MESDDEMQTGKVESTWKGGVVGEGETKIEEVKRISYADDKLETQSPEVLFV